MAWWDHEELKSHADRSDRYKVAFPSEYSGKEVAEAQARLNSEGRQVPRYDPDDTSIHPQTKKVEWAFDHVTHRSLLSGRVKRYNVWPTITSQTVGDHTWGVYHTYFRIWGAPEGNVAYYIHVHDVEELVVGDNPFPSKMMFPKLKEGTTEAEEYARERLRIPTGTVSDTERHRVKVCDLLEMMTFGMQEREMGNLLATPIIERTGDTARRLAKENLTPEDERLVLDYRLARLMDHESVLKKQGSTY